MGLLGNVAEVKDLRHRLMTPELLTTFADLLDSNSDGIEVSLTATDIFLQMYLLHYSVLGCLCDVPCSFFQNYMPGLLDLLCIF